MTGKKSAEETSRTGTRLVKLRLPDLLRGPFDIKSVALTGLFVLAVFYTMYFMRAMLLPLVLALLLSYLLAPLVRLLGRIRIRRGAFGAAIVLLSLVGLLIYGVSRLAEPAADWLEKAPYSLHQLEQKILPLKKPMEKVAQASGEIEKLTTTAEPQAQTVVVKRNAFAESFLTQTPEFIASGVVMLILLYFLLAYDGVFLEQDRKSDPAFGGQETRRVDGARDRDADFALPPNHYPDQYRAWRSPWGRPCTCWVCATRSCGACSSRC